MTYKKLFWAFILLFDFRIQGLDILPDIIGYILFYQSLSVLENKNVYFNKGKKIALPMIFLSIFDLYQTNKSTLGIFGIVLGLAIMVINLLMIYNICLGIGFEARQKSDIMLENLAKKSWNIYLASNILIGLSSIILQVIPVMFIIIFIVSIISYVFMLKLMNEASYKL